MSSNKFLDAHNFIQLNDGKCHYRIDGPSDGQLLLLIHGATVPLWEFDRIVPFLNQAGFRTIRLDLFGHGYSERPDKPHDFNLFVKQIFEFLACLNFHEKIYLLGHSMGAVIAAKLLLNQPERFHSLIMVAPVVNFFANQKSAALLKLPVLGEWMVKRYVVPMLRRRRAKRYQNIQGGRLVKLFYEQVSLPHFGRSLLYIMRGDTLTDQRDLYSQLNKQDKPILVLHACEDQVVTAKQIETIRKLTSRAEIKELESMAHAMLLTHPEVTAPYIIEFLSR
jgi:pimeloyl-ACP methyl ester carboxylesterase